MGNLVVEGHKMTRAGSLVESRPHLHIQTETVKIATKSISLGSNNNKLKNIQTHHKIGFIFNIYTA